MIGTVPLVGAGTRVLHPGSPGPAVQERANIMASISTGGSGRRRIIFTDKDNHRKTIYLGKISLRDAGEIKIKIDALNAAKIGEYAPANETRAWLSKIGDGLRKKLVRVGLVEPRAAKEPAPQLKLDDWTRRYIDSRTDVRQSTARNLEAARSRLIEFFGDKPMVEITRGDAKALIIWLKGKYAHATVGRTIGRARQFFQAAVDHEAIDKNPFAKIKAPPQVNDSRKFFLTLDAAYKVLEACPNAEWRLLFALSRFGGLRCPSEHLVLTWPDVDWERGRFRVDSPKTGVRWVPIFAELRPHLEEAFELAAEGSLHVINRYRDASQNLRTELQRIIRRAGLEPWPKLFHNLRASRETELAATFPIHVVCAWIGHAAAIAQKHYLQVTDDDFKAACRASPAAESDRATRQTTRENGETTRQTTRHTAALGSTERQDARTGVQNQGDSLASAASCALVPVGAEEGSAPCRTRTYNPLIKSQLLCQLS